MAVDAKPIVEAIAGVQALEKIPRGSGDWISYLQVKCPRHQKPTAARAAPLVMHVAGRSFLDRQPNHDW
ncbi:MAG: hypothetical protein QE494_11090 [Ramlibacter sp.]|uniref:hypothetical protein n=1 Tax=Ramlibacter sp. TaxID=1917967 RepID=UPI00261FDD5F|nr:hypothetical protein [Ramlibacter sp.]MDH4376833.1 hypothetical protein [Ramlibacter sp.]